MFYTSNMTDQEFLEFVRVHPVSGGCGSTAQTDKAAAQQTAFNATMLSQGAQVFGADNKVFNEMMSSFHATIPGGPGQQGWSAAETNAVNSQIINNAAVSARNVGAAVGNNLSAVQGRTGQGGMAAGSSAALEASVAEAVEASKSTALNQATQENYAQGVKNYEFAAQGMENLPNVYNNVPKFNEVTQTGLTEGMKNAQAADAASNWWVKPVEGLAGAGISMATGGLGSMAMGGGFLQGAGASLAGNLSRSGSSGSMIDAGTPQYNPWQTPNVPAPTDAQAGMPGLGALPAGILG